MSAEKSLEIWLFPLWREALRKDSDAAWKTVSDATYYAIQGCTAGGGVNSDADEMLRFLSEIVYLHRQRTAFAAGVRAAKRRAKKA